MEDKTTLTDINDVMKVLNDDQKALKDCYSSHERKFIDLFGYKPNQTISAWDVVQIIHRYHNGNGQVNAADKN
jgi:hypothetical protein